MEKCRYIVTQYGNDFDYNFCRGVFDDFTSACGCVLKAIIDNMEDSYDEENVISIRYDHNSDSFIDIVCKQPETKNHSDLEDVYRVFYLREKEDESKEWKNASGCTAKE